MNDEDFEKIKKDVDKNYTPLTMQTAKVIGKFSEEMTSFYNYIYPLNRKYSLIFLATIITTALISSTDTTDLALQDLKDLNILIKENINKIDKVIVK